MLLVESNECRFPWVTGRKTGLVHNSLPVGGYFQRNIPGRRPQLLREPPCLVPLSGPALNWDSAGPQFHGCPDALWSFLLLPIGLWVIPVLGKVTDLLIGRKAKTDRIQIFLEGHQQV